MKFVNIKELVFKNNGFEATKIEHRNYANDVTKEEFNNVIDNIVYKLTANNKNNVMRTPMGDNKEVCVCYNETGLLDKILVVYVTDVQDKLITEEIVATPIVEEKKDDIKELINTILHDEDIKSCVNDKTRALMIASLVSSKIDEEKIKNMITLGASLVK